MSKYLNIYSTSSGSNISFNVNDNSYTYKSILLGKEYSYYCLEVEYLSILNTITCVNTFGKKWWDMFYENNLRNQSCLPYDMVTYINENIEAYDRTRKIEKVFE